MTTPKVEVIVYRDPDEGDDVRVFVDGQLLEGVDEVIDPGRGYELAEWQQDSRNMRREGPVGMSPAAFDVLMDFRDQAEESQYMEGEGLDDEEEGETSR